MCIRDRYYNDYDSIDEDARGLYRKAMAAFGGIAPSYHIELLDKPTIYWDFHSLLLGIQMMFSFMLVDGDQPLRLCKHCQKVFLGCLLYTSETLSVKSWIYCDSKPPAGISSNR